MRVFSGKTGSTIVTLIANTTYRTGLSVATARDVDGDGIPDLLAGALNQGTGIQLIDRGAVVVFSIVAGSPLHVIGGGAAYQHLGISLAGLGDINKDGYGEFAAGSYFDSALLAGAGAIQIFDGYNASLMAQIDGSNLGDHLGAALAPVGDYDGDGVLELLAGGPGINVSGVGNVGKAKLYRVAPDGLVVYGTPSPGCFGAEVMYGNTTPAVGNLGFRLSTVNSAPNNLALGLVTDTQPLQAYDLFGLGFLFNVGILGAVEIYGFDINTDTLGRGFAAAPIPNNPWLSGKSYYGQVISYWANGIPCTPGTVGLSASYGVEIHIQ